MKEKLVSFIIPAYNAEDTIERCLNSIYALSLKREEFEVIVIDDASTDDTCDVIERYVRDVLCMMSDVCTSNLTLLRQKENHRQGAARNRGVNVAKGEYICFVDADDAVTKGVVEAIKMAKEKDTDMTAYHIGYADSTGKITREEIALSYNKDEIFSGMDLQKKHPWWFSGPVAYIYNREFIEQVNYLFAEDVLYEDADFVMAHIFYAQRMVYSSIMGYMVYCRDGSATRRMTHLNIADFMLLGERMLRLYERVRAIDAQDVDIQRYADEMLEGACWNMYISSKRLIKLDGVKEVRAFYRRMDSVVNRITISSDIRLRKYYWNTWTTICIRHKYVALMLLSFLIPLFKLSKVIMRKK